MTHPPPGDDAAHGPSPDVGLLAHARAIAARLDTAHEAWVVGVARPVGVDADLPSTSGDLNVVLSEAHATGAFPTGPLAYGRNPISIASEPPFHTARIDMPDDDGDPFISVELELGPGGFVAVAGTRRGQVSPGTMRASHVFLADVEAGVADLLVFLEVRCAQIGYRGPTRVLLALFCDVADEPLGLRCLDEITGEMDLDVRHRAFDPMGFDYVVGEIDLGHAAAYDIAEELAERFGAPGPQLLLPPAIKARAGSVTP